MFKIKTIGLWVVAASMCCAPAIAVAKNSFLVAPGRLQIDLEQLRTHSFIITNTGDEVIRVNVDPIYLPIDDSTMKAGRHLSPDVAMKENIARNVRVSPRRLNLQPGERRDIRVQISPLSSPEPGDYRAHLLVKMNETAYSSEKTSEDEGMTMKLNVNMETAVALYGRKDEPVVDLSMSCENTDSGKTEVAIINPTDWRFEGRLAIGETTLKPVVMLRESEKTMTLDLASDMADSAISITDLEGGVVTKAICTKR